MCKGPRPARPGAPLGARRAPLPRREVGGAVCVYVYMYVYIYIYIYIYVLYLLIYLIIYLCTHIYIVYI